MTTPKRKSCKWISRYWTNWVIKLPQPIHSPFFFSPTTPSSISVISCKRWSSKSKLPIKIPSKNSQVLVFQMSIYSEYTNIFMFVINALWCILIHIKFCYSTLIYYALKLHKTTASFTLWVCVNGWRNKDKEK